MSKNIYKILTPLLICSLYFKGAYASERLRVMFSSNRKQVDIQVYRAKVFEIKDIRANCLDAASEDMDEILSVIDRPASDQGDGMSLIESIESEKKITITFEKGIKISGLKGVYDSILIKNELGGMKLNDGYIRGDLEIRAGSGTLMLINIIDIEEYLRYTISREMNSSWPVEALKAQTVLARTYALKKKYRSNSCLYDIGVTTMEQVYGTFKEDSIEVIAAVSGTIGEVLKYKGEIVEAFYHSCCGGHTSDSKEIFGREIPYLKGVECACKGECPYGRGWSYKVRLQDIEKTFGIKNIQDITSGDDKIVITGNKRVVLSKNSFRGKIGFKELKSSYYVLRRSGNYLVIEGKGFGHTTGLCQYGAKRMAEEGKNYREILMHYFPGVSIEKIY